MISAATVISALALGMTGAHAAGMFGSSDIRDGSIRSVDVKDGTLQTKDLSRATIQQLHGQKGATGARGATGAKGAKGAKGATGVSGLQGAFYATAYYDNGDTNAGAIAAVACDANPNAQNFTAIAGGVQVLGLDADANNRNTPVSSSFPGRMDWNTNTPKANRLDGWIVQFGGNAGAESDKAPEKVKVWALCVPTTNIPVKQTFTQSA